MSDPKHTWNPDDGPAPTNDELLESARLADALDKGAAADVDTAALLSTALRVRTARRPDDDAVRAVTERAISAALQHHRASWWTRAPRLRIAAAAAAVLTAAGVGGGAWVASRPRPMAAELHDVAAFDAPVEPGAGSVPSSRLYDRGLRSYRAALLGGDR
jgi:hypothetical protein